jgi:hypothetical protein
MSKRSDKEGMNKKECDELLKTKCVKPESIFESE